MLKDPLYGWIKPVHRVNAMQTIIRIDRTDVCRRLAECVEICAVRRILTKPLQQQTF
jgi:hypothetical protein